MIAHSRKHVRTWKEIKQNQEKEARRKKKENFLGKRDNESQMHKWFDKAGIPESWFELEDTLETH